MWLDYTVGCDEDGQPARRAGAHRRRHAAPTRASATRCSSAPPVTPAAPTRSPNVDVEGEGGLHEQPALRRDARLRRQPVQLRDRGRARPARRAGRDRRLGDPLAQRARGRATASAPGQKLGPGVGLKKTLLAVRDAYRDARYAGIACGVKNTGIGNGMTEYGRAVLRVGGGRDGDALPLLDGDGPGRPHGPAADRLRGARPAARAGPGRGRHRARARDRARRPRRARPCSAAAP